ncbi:aldose epimerase family protein [Solibacillus silvestris]
MIEVRSFGQINKHPVYEVILTNTNGMYVSSCTLGCTITAIATPDANGIIENVVCSFDTAEKYKQYPQFFGAAIGPFAGRLEDAVLEINGVSFQAKANEGHHLLHGGNDGFHNQLWQFETGVSSRGQFVKYFFNFESVDFPGELNMSITYTLTASNELIISYEGISDADTILNCTNHSYFNLSGNLKRTIEGHALKFSSREMLYIEDNGLPLGNIENVIGTVFDFNEKKYLREVIGSDFSQVKMASGGIDHPFLLEKKEIELLDEESGRKLTIITDEQALVVYTGNKIGSGYSFKEAPAQNFLGVCLEVQNVPNSVKHKHFPSSIVKKGVPYRCETFYRFTHL